MINLGFLGTGNMGRAIIKGIAAAKEKNAGKLGGCDVSLFAYDKDSEKLSALKKYGVTPCVNEQDLGSKCGYILLAVKPQALGSVLSALKPSVTENHVFISICAGISAEFIKEHTVSEVRTAIVMPNTPAMLGLGASAIARDGVISDDEFDFAKSVIASCGLVREIPMDKMKEIICINGSSPAFIYLFAKGFVDYAKEVGIDEVTALELFAQSLVGSAKMLTDSGMTVEQLIKQVSSPGGTTIAGLDKLYEGKLEETVNKACKACTDRAYELAKN
ncbi:MAG: pyrroline-5-carboxylate reductase [Firmicutes bacterium]|nr:pyrroline-5-carboxylate reductase [[Eubacterium] siraeum]MCM1487107.1 pyrroline-5-carboxylate reductase [Bacillota bacterium]